MVLESDDSLQNGKITLEILQDKMTNIDGSRLILIDYDLLLRDAKIFRAHSEIVDAVNLLSHSAKTRVYMITGQSRAIMEMAFSHGNVGLICEYGCFIRHPIELRLCLASSSQSPLTDDWIQLSELGDETWRERIKSLVKFYTDHTPGSYVEEREKVIIWHFEEADLEFGAWQASELQANLEKILGHVPVAIHLEKDSLTIRPALVDYSIAMRRVMTDLEKADSACGLIACISNLVDDLKLSSIATQWPSIKQILPICMSKKKMTSNGYHIDNAKELLPLLNGLANQ